MMPRVGPARCVQPGSAVDPREVDGVPGMGGKLLQILELRSAVALAEGVNMVDVAQHRTRALGEPVRPRSPEVPCLHDAAVNVRHAGGDEPPRLEPALALGDLDGADPARPFVDVLEQVAVDRFQMVQVEIARRHGFKEAQGDKLAFRRFQRRRVLDVRPVAENGVVGRTTVSRGRSFRRGDATAALYAAEDMGAATLLRPTLALEHLEHSDLFRRQGITLDRLQVRGFGQQLVRGGTRG